MKKIRKIIKCVIAVLTFLLGGNASPGATGKPSDNHEED